MLFRSNITLNENLIDASENIVYINNLPVFTGPLPKYPTDASAWSQFPASENVDINNNQLLNVNTVYFDGSNNIKIIF